ncbi:MAG: serine/threonine protein kinase [Alphaproteobacteria bacterium]|nr:serine/threonine protein kinase [Alphaproteobacteria bacterium]
MSGLLGRILHGHQLQSIAGNGNMGRIFRGVPVGGGEPVAVKVLHTELARDAELVERFEREFANGSRVVHENVVRLYHCGTEDGVHFQVLELLDGLPLDRLLADAPFPLERVVSLGAQIAAGLQAAHAIGVVHRDLKPENVMVLPGDRVKVFDFGLARARIDSQPTLTADGMRLGTPMFMAPEYIAEGRLDHRADLYALGIALFELATGEEPFHGPPFKILHLHVTQDPPRLREVHPDADPGLEALVAELLAKEPEDRPQTAGQVEARLRALV